MFCEPFAMTISNFQRFFRHDNVTQQNMTMDKFLEDALVLEVRDAIMV